MVLIGADLIEIGLCLLSGMFGGGCMVMGDVVLMVAGLVFECW